MSAECIHGLDEGLCDVCFPKKAPEPAPRDARTRTAARNSVPGRAPSKVPAPTPNRTSARTGRAPSLRDEKPVSIDVQAQRIYHVTHIDNLAGIVASGAILADSALGENRPPVDISSEETRAHRRSVEVDETTTVSDFVPFFLSPHAALWADLRLGAAGPHWSKDARATSASDYVLLVGSLQTASALADGDASHALTRFATDRETFLRALVRLMPDELALGAAEVLVRGRFPVASIATIGVANMTMRERVRELLAGADAAPRVAVYPPWFQPQEPTE